jgi:hypothetical protein
MPGGRPKKRRKPPPVSLRYPGFGLWGLIPQDFSKRRDVGSADLDLETGDHPCLSMCLSLLSDDIYLHIGKLKRERGFSVGHWPLIKVLKRY